MGQDACKMLNEAIQRQPKKLNIKVVAILNDTTGTLVKGAYDDPRTCIGLILGTGCNGAYLESADKVLNWVGDKKNAQEVIIDPEWGAFGDNGCIDFIKTSVDQELDMASLLPKSFTYEKYFAGKYLGEIVRLCLVHLHDLKAFMPENDLEFEATLKAKDAFTTQMVSQVIEKDANFEELKIIFKEEFGEEFGMKLTENDLKILTHVCNVLSERGALLVAIPMAVFIERMPQKEHVAIAITGSLYKCHPKMKALLEMHIKKIVPGRSFHTFLSDDGSGKGAGLVAAIAARLASAQ